MNNRNYVKEKAHARKAESLLLRLNYCAGMLVMHDIISDGLRMKIHKRLMKLKAKGLSQ